MHDSDDRPEPIARPVTRGDCRNVPRPCPFASCRHSLLLDVQANGVITFNSTGEHPAPVAGATTDDEEFEALAERVTDAWASADNLPSCALDVIDAAIGDETPLADVAASIGITRQRADQILKVALPKLVTGLAMFSDKRGAK